MFDLILRGGMVVTGAGNPWFKADVAIRNGKIIEVGQVYGDAREVLRVDGLVVAPGFIDMHDHSDLAILVEGRAENKVRMGVSTIVLSLIHI